MILTNIVRTEALPPLPDCARVYVMGTFRLPDDGIILVSRDLDTESIDEIVKQKYGDRGWIRGH